MKPKDQPALTVLGAGTRWYVYTDVAKGTTAAGPFATQKRADNWARANAAAYKAGGKK